MKNLDDTKVRELIEVMHELEELEELVKTCRARREELIYNCWELIGTTRVALILGLSRQRTHIILQIEKARRQPPPD